MTHPANPTEPAGRAPDWWRPFAVRLLPGAVFAAFLAYYWRIYNPAARIPAYGDVLENIWAIDWFFGGLRSGIGSILFNPNVFMPEGWSLATFSNGLGVFLLAGLPAILTSAAVAFNLVQLASFFIAYFGAYRLARLVAGHVAAAAVALLYLLWGGRWQRVGGHLNILMGSALLPWLVLALERAITSGRARWAIVAGLLWAATISFSLYFIWIGLFLVIGWLAGALLGGRIAPRGLARCLALTGGAALLFCAPYLYIYWRAQGDAAGFDISHVNSWSMSVNWLVALYPDHPLEWLHEISNRQVGGVRNEASFSGFGLVLPLLVVLGLASRGRRPAQWAAIWLIVGVGLLLSLGITLQWNGAPVAVEGLRPINDALWSAGHALKPDVFPGPDAPPEFAAAVPLPGQLFAILVPFFEGARVPARYLLVATPGVLLLAAMALDRLPGRGARRRWLQLLVIALLLVEAARRPIVGVPFPPPPHPAFAWLDARPLPPGESLLSLTAPVLEVIIPDIGGETLWATTLHRQPIGGGAGSILPAHTAYLRDWLFAHPDPAGAAEFPWLLRGYGVRYVLLHMPPEPSSALGRLAEGTAELLPQGCFDNPAGPPWGHPICILEVTPPPAPAIDVYPTAGWSGAEAWGLWAMGRESAVRWVSTSGAAARFAVEAFPHCIEGVPQTIEIVPQTIDIVVGGAAGDETVLASHQWANCDPWSGEIAIPAELVAVGWNEIGLRFGRADSPAEVTGGQNPDTRELSAGFTRFERLP